MPDGGAAAPEREVRRPDVGGDLRGPPGDTHANAGNESVSRPRNCYSGDALEQQHDVCTTFVNDITKRIHAVDADHPVTSTDAWTGAWPPDVGQRPGPDHRAHRHPRQRRYRRHGRSALRTGEHVRARHAPGLLAPRVRRPPEPAVRRSRRTAPLPAVGAAGKFATGHGSPVARRGSAQQGRARYPGCERRGTEHHVPTHTPGHVSTRTLRGVPPGPRHPSSAPRPAARGPGAHRQRTRPPDRSHGSGRAR